MTCSAHLEKNASHLLSFIEAIESLTSRERAAVSPITQKVDELVAKIFPIFTASSCEETTRAIRQAGLEDKVLHSPTDHQTYLFLEELGRGGSGYVVKALNLETRTYVAIKLFDPKALKKYPAVRESVVRESAMVGLRMPGLVPIHEKFEGTGLPTAFVMEYCDGGDALRACGSHVPLLDKQIILRQVVATLCCLHEAKKTHGDIKPANILFKATPGGGGVVKLTDFGSHSSPQLSDLLSLPACTLSMAPPEVFYAPKTSLGQPATDVWQLGATAYQILTGTPLASALFPGATDPYTVSSCLSSLVVGFEPPGQAPIDDLIKKTVLDPNAQAFLLTILKVDPSQRPPMATVLQHPFLEEPLIGPGLSCCAAAAGADATPDSSLIPERDLVTEYA